MRSLWHAILLFRLRPLRGASPPLREWLPAAAQGGRASRYWLFIAGASWLLLASLLFLVSSRLVHYQLWDAHADSFKEMFEEILEDWGDGERRSYLGAWAASFAIPTILLLPLRLIWLRARVKCILRSRDRCAFCGHGLTGVPLSPDASVTCPECARHTPAIDTWHEVDASADRPAFRPAADLLPRFWTRRRLKFTAKLAAAAAGLALVAYASWWSIREVGIRREAALAREERPGAEAINARFATELPNPLPGRPLIVDLVIQIDSKAKSISRTFSDSLTARGEPDDLYPDPSIITARTTTEENFEKKLKFSRELMDQYRQAGIYDDLDQLSSASPWSGRSMRTVDQDPSGGFLGLSSVRAALRITAARMRLAVEAEDLPQFTAASNTAMSLAASAYSGPLLIDWLVGVAASELVLREWAYAATHNPNPALLNHIELGLAALPSTPANAQIDRELLLNLDTVAWYFSDPARVRKGLGAPELKEKLGIGGELQAIVSAFGFGAEPETTRLGTYSENRDAIVAVLGWYSDLALQDPWQRPKSAAPSTGDLVIAGFLTGPFPQVLRSGDRLELRRRAVQVMVALEKHRLEHHEYPAALTDLSPQSKARNTLDPYSGKPFGYRRIDAAADPSKRRYVLWTVGADGIDNAGAKSIGDSALRDSGAGTDLILSDPDW